MDYCIGWLAGNPISDILGQLPTCVSCAISFKVQVHWKEIHQLLFELK